MWSRGTSALAPIVNKSAQCQDVCQAHVEAGKAWFVTEGSIPVLTAAKEFVVDRQIALPAFLHDRHNSLGLPSGL